MSSREWVFRIQDILKSIDKIDGYLKGMTLDRFKKNELIIDAVVRNLEIIGEASKNIPSTIRRSHTHIPWDIMCGMRDILIHQYFGVDLNIVWHTAKEDLPSIQKHLEHLFQENSSL
ncbi:MAG TPA: DUF86 domain-containing protein [Chlamydiales bacterium]|nr:DUF86 domain-containing protein [Chlamydiales bacterium]